MTPNEPPYRDDHGRFIPEPNLDKMRSRFFELTAEQRERADAPPIKTGVFPTLDDVRARDAQLQRMWYVIVFWGGFFIGFAAHFFGTR